MKILIVCSGNSINSLLELASTQPFIYEQTEQLKKSGIEIDFFLIRGKGILGYLRNLPGLRRKIKQCNCDLIHAHYGLSGFVAILQLKKPVVITFHGSDINLNFLTLFPSNIALQFAKVGIFVSKKLEEKLFIKRPEKSHIIPCGVDLSIFHPMDKIQCRNELGWNLEEKILLFSSAFRNPVKNYSLAKRAIDLCEHTTLIELTKYTRSEVNRMLNACDGIIMTSFSEGSPQVIKEAMACNCPIITTDVGDVKEIIKNTIGCYITTYDYKDIAEKIKKVLLSGERTNGRENISVYDNILIAQQVIEVYHSVSLGKTRI